jgi:hypothetical protein
MKQKVRGVGVGTVSLVMIFAVLCLTVFAMLTLSTSNAEKALADRTAAFVTGYYEADTLATKIKAEIIKSYRDGTLYGAASLPDEPYDIIGFEVTIAPGVQLSYEFEENGTIFASYSCEVNEVQDLSVRLSLAGGSYTVLEWKTVYSQDWEIDDGITVWDGDSFGGELFDMDSFGEELFDMDSFSEELFDVDSFNGELSDGEPLGGELFDMELFDGEIEILD